ncbi:retrovirus-related Pol polyprotein from transposon opus [Trichonephila clavipes]|uniref:RNA-directed DNA polymerase n=1 Tax=Trichonephila clavipes TaxID=2585209 RepID=A0A8X6RAB9_TRICX|nr:retrovirus-related Pol polyprotein from transposon opus [Trichonephila clavipes]
MRRKVRAIVQMKPPRNSKEVSNFLGMSEWYVKFIKNYADVCEPLSNLKQKLKKFCWSIEAQKAFDVVKAAITKAPVLKLPFFKKPFELFTEKSSIGVGAVLNQEQRSVVFASRTLSNVGRNNTVTERERLALVWVLNKFRTYLGSLPIKVITDHAALICLIHGKNLSSRMIRWVLKLIGFNIEWEHRCRTQNAVAHVLLRNPVERRSCRFPVLKGVHGRALGFRFLLQGVWKLFVERIATPYVYSLNESLWVHKGLLHDRFRSLFLVVFLGALQTQVFRAWVPSRVHCSQRFLTAHFRAIHPGACSNTARRPACQPFFIPMIEGLSQTLTNYEIISLPARLPGMFRLLKSSYNRR